MTNPRILLLFGLLLLWGILARALEPMEVPVVDTVDVLERNHFYGEQGEIVFTQHIGWSYDVADLHVVFWRLNKDEKSPITPTSKGYQWQWWDGDTLRRVESKVYRETWTQFDPELRDRAHVAAHDRRGLTKTFSVETSERYSNTSPSDLDIPTPPRP